MIGKTPGGLVASVLQKKHSRFRLIPLALVGFPFLLATAGRLCGALGADVPGAAPASCRAMATCRSPPSASRLSAPRTPSSAMSWRASSILRWPASFSWWLAWPAIPRDAPDLPGAPPGDRVVAQESEVPLDQSRHVLRVAAVFFLLVAVAHAWRAIQALPRWWERPRSRSGPPGAGGRGDRLARRRGLPRARVSRALDPFAAAGAGR